MSTGATREDGEELGLQDITEADEIREGSFNTPTDQAEGAQQSPGETGETHAEPKDDKGQKGGDDGADRVESEGTTRRKKKGAGGTSPVALGRGSPSMKRKGTLKNLSAMASKSIRNMIDPGKKLGLYRESKVTDGTEAFGFEKGHKPFLVVHPYSAERMTWDAISFLMLMYCCIMVPYNLSFASETICESYKFILNSVVDAFFLLDILVNFRTAYFSPNARRRILTKQELREKKEQDSIVTDTREIAKYYVDPRNVRHGGQGGFFTLDCIGSIPWDWIMCGGGMEDGTDSANVAKIARAPRLLKVLRILRLLRLLRLQRVAVLLRKFKDLMHVNPGLLQLILFLAFLVLSTHWLGCMWFFLGTILDDDEALVLMASKDATSPSGWASAFSLQTEESSLHDDRNLQVRCNTFEGNVLDPNCISMSETAQYIVSIYWATTSLSTTGFGDISPVSLPEVVFSIFVLLTGGFMFAYMVANIALMLDKIDIRATLNRQKVYEFEGFMHREKLPGNLRRKIRKYFERTHMEQRRLPVYLGELSGSLSKEIYLNIFKDIVVKVPFFAHFDDAPLALIIRHFRFKSTPAGETVFRAGDFGEWMFFLHKGEIELSVAPSNSTGREASWTIGSGAFFGENAILGRKTRITTARTVSWCTMYILSLSDVERTIEKYPKCRVLFEKFKMQMADYNVKRDVQNLVKRWGRRDGRSASQDGDEKRPTKTLSTNSARLGRFSPGSGSLRRRVLGAANTHDGVVSTSSRKLDAKGVWRFLRSRLLPSVADQEREDQRLAEEEARKQAIQAIVQQPLDDVSVSTHTVSLASPVRQAESPGTHSRNGSPDARPSASKHFRSSETPVNSLVLSKPESDIHPIDGHILGAATAALGAGYDLEQTQSQNPTLAASLAALNDASLTVLNDAPSHTEDPLQNGRVSSTGAGSAQKAPPENKRRSSLLDTDTPLGSVGTPGYGNWTPHVGQGYSDIQSGGAGAAEHGNVNSVVRELQEVIKIQQADLQLMQNHFKMLTGLVETSHLEMQRAKSRAHLLEAENEQLKQTVKQSFSRTASSAKSARTASSPVSAGPMPSYSNMDSTLSALSPQ